MQHAADTPLLTLYSGRAVSSQRRLFRLFLTALLAAPMSVAADEPADSLAAPQLQEIEVVAAPANVSSRLAAGTVRYNAATSTGLMRRMGENDIVGRIKSLPGVSAAGDYGAGLIVDGSDASQTLYTIGGVPVFYPYRFGGLFSTFNTPHYQSATFERSAHGASMPSRLGAGIDFEPYSALPRRCGGTANAGMLASALTLRIPAGPVGIYLSGRISYVDQIYSGLLRFDDSRISYDFGDLNATVNWQIDSCNTISVNGFHSSDRLNYNDSNYAMDTRMRWHNTMVSLTWRHRGRLAGDHRLFYSGFGNRLALDMPQIWMRVPSGIQAAGISGSLTPVPDMAPWSVGTGYELTAYRLRPQSVAVDGMGQEHHPADHQAKAFEARIYGDICRRISSVVALSAGLSLAWYGSGDYSALSPDPRLRATITPGSYGDRITLHAGLYNQPVHVVGLSDIGLASDFWMASGRGLPVSRALSFTADYDRPLPWAGLQLAAGAYVRRIIDAAEYNGMLFDLIDDDYDAAAHVASVSGYNTGAYLSVRRESGWITGQAGVSYGAARRHYGTGYRPGVHDPGWSLDADIDWRINAHWSVGAQFTLAQGRRYTPADAVYIMAGNLVCHYGAINSGRLPAYHRLDLGAVYRFATGQLRHYASFSLINAYGHRNIEIQYFTLDADTGDYRLYQSASLYRFMPSLSYTVEF